VLVGAEDDVLVSGIVEIDVVETNVVEIDVVETDVVAGVSTVVERFET
jgi:hypothetical protein